MAHRAHSPMDALWWLHDAAGFWLAFAQCLLEEDEWGGGCSAVGYLRSCCMVLMQALLLSPRQLCSSNYLLWVPPSESFTLGFVSQMSEDLPGKRVPLKSLHHSSWCIGVRVCSWQQTCGRKPFAEGTEAAQRHLHGLQNSLEV